MGMDFRPQAGGARCQGDVSTGTPTKVTYEAGKTYTLAWAPKNHVAAECTNAFIPDNFLRVYMHPYNGATDPTQDQFKANQVKASFSDDPHVSGQIDYKGSRTVPNFVKTQTRLFALEPLRFLKLLPLELTPFSGTGLSILRLIYMLRVGRLMLHQTAVLIQEHPIHLW